MKTNQTKNYLNSYYKVNLNKVRLMIYDFNKDMIVEENKNKINYKVEKILNNSKNENENHIGADVDYPSFSYKTKKGEKANKNNKIDDINQKEINEEKIFIRRINDAINNRSNERGTKLNIISIIFVITFAFFSILMILFDFYCLNRIKDLIKLIKNIVVIKYCNIFSIYFIRELTLLNYNFGLNTFSSYDNFPGNDREIYRNLIRTKLLNYCIETQSNIMEILSSSFSLSKSITKNISNTLFNSKLLPNTIGNIKGDPLTTLMQYNSAFFSLTSGHTRINQADPDVFNFMQNSFNDYAEAMDLLLDKFHAELIMENKTILIFFIVCSIVLFIVMVIFYFLIVMSLISAVKSRINYMEVFYGINSNTIKNLIFDCENLMNKLKKTQFIIDEGESDEESENKRNIIHNNNKNDNVSRNSLNNNIGYKKNNPTMSKNIKLFIIFFLILLIIEYTYYPFNFYQIYNLSNQSFVIYEFFYSVIDFHSTVLNLFNSYREYLLDNRTIINEMYAFDYLVKLEHISYNTIPDHVNYLNYFVLNNIND